MLGYKRCRMCGRTFRGATCLTISCRQTIAASAVVAHGLGQVAAAQQAQVQALSAMHAQQASMAQAAHAERVRQERMRAMHANVGAVIQESLLELRALARRLDGEGTDPLAALLDYLRIDARTAGIDSSNSDPAQLGALVELKDQLAQGRENVERRVEALPDGKESLERVGGWIDLATERHRRAQQVAWRVARLAEGRPARGSTARPPTSVAEGEAQLEAIYQYRSNAESFALTPLVGHAGRVRHMLRVHGAAPLIAIEVSRAQRGQLLREFEGALTGLSYWVLYIFGTERGGAWIFWGVFWIPFAILTLAAESPIFVFLGAIIGSPLGIYAYLKTERIKALILAYERDRMLEESIRQQADLEIAESNAAVEALRQFEAFESDPDGGGRLAECSAWRPDLSQKIAAVAEAS